MRFRNSKHLPLILPLVFFASASFVPAQEALTPTTSSGSTSTSSSTETTSTAPTTETSTVPTTTTATSTTVATENTASRGNGVGVFSKTPVKIYLSLSEGYDDNVNTISGHAQSSAFTSANVILDYTFGDPRLQIILNAGAGYTQVSFDLSAYKGQTIQIYLVGTEDSSLRTSFVVDDFLLNVTTP